MRYSMDYSKQQNTESIFKLHHMLLNNSQVTINEYIDSPKLYGSFGSHTDSPRDCNLGLTTHDEVCLRYPQTQLRVQHFNDGKVSCYDIGWQALSLDVKELRDCYSLGTSHWFGGFQHVRQPWPLENIDMEQTPYASADLFFHKDKTIGGVQERIFFNSDGYGIFIPDDVPLYMSINGSNDGKICLAAKLDGYPYMNNVGPTKLSYTICQASNAKTIRSFMLKKYLKTPSTIPDETLFTKPIWCTWAQYNKQVNESAVMDYANTILKHGFSHSQIEIDDDWTPFYGDLDFNKKFPDPKNMIKKLNAMGFRITLWVHPFMELGSRSFEEAANKGYLIRSKGDSVPALVKWWDGDRAGCLDVTNPEAVDWFINNLKYLQTEYGISSFKFDAGESHYLPKNYETKEPLKSPEDFARLWATIAYRSDTTIRHQEVRIAWKTQDLPIFVRMFDRASSWDDMAGIKTLIPTMLTFGVIGYPFVLADMVGGNAYDDLISFNGGAYPNRELFIRWMEINTFFPTIQYSIAPWIYDQEVVDLCKKYTQLHEEYAPLMIKLAKQSIGSGDPIIRPLWWISPNDQTALTIDSQFLVGDEVLVAPVIEQGKRSRDIYLPKGKWKDVLRGGIQEGPKWLLNYKAKLSELPHFTQGL
ncbi:hypothetical protein SNE40_014099 [Patella caerulea]|uniref:Uncharacterized protein n=1 Tax=Patella caerulea TaxID=87958 RepID=A0AAN8JHD2_PATCE